MDSRTPTDRAVVGMGNDWDARAEANPTYHIAAGRRDWPLEEFYSSGREIVTLVVDPALEALEVDPRGRSALEIGCGMGRLFEGLADRFDTVSGIDISAQMVALGKEHCPVEADWLVGDGAKLSGVSDGTVDHIISFEVFQHISSVGVINSYMEEVARVLAPSGTFQIQLRQGSDTRRQSLVRAMPRPLRLASAWMLRAMGVLPVPGDIDSWLGVIVAPEDAIAGARTLGLVDVAVLADDIHERAMGYWLIGRKRPASRQAGNGATKPGS